MPEPQTLACIPADAHLLIAFPVTHLLGVDAHPAPEARSLRHALGLPPTRAPSRWLRFAAPGAPPIAFQIHEPLTIQPLACPQAIPSFLEGIAKKSGWQHIFRSEDAWVLLFDPFQLHRACPEPR